MIIRLKPQKALITLFVALGPLGNILTPHFFPPSFRTYYFLLPLFPLFFSQARERIVKIGIFFLPLLLYCALSAFYVETHGTANEPHTLFRFFLLFCQFFFILGAVSSLTEKHEISDLLKTYLKFYFISLSIGYVFFIGFYLKVIPFALIDRFSVLTQFGYSILRFSPGSYPNEYGIVSSFVLSVLTLTYVHRSSAPFGYSKRKLSFLMLATFIAFLLTTTRAAYLSYLICLIYITWTSGKFLRYLSYFSASIFSLFCILLLFKLNMFRVVAAGFTQKLTEGSLGERFNIWTETVDKAQNHALLGTGFGTLTNVHNVYLQLFFELGCIGVLLLLATLTLSFIESYFRYQNPISDEESSFFRRIRMIGLINVLSFAASNHNLNHHLTWFIIFLGLSSLRSWYRAHSSLSS